VPINTCRPARICHLVTHCICARQQA
jgi:hypothetical protein